MYIKLRNINSDKVDALEQRVRNFLNEVGVQSPSKEEIHAIIELFKEEDS